MSGKAPACLCFDLRWPIVLPSAVMHDLSLILACKHSVFTEGHGSSEFKNKNKSRTASEGREPSENHQLELDRVRRPCLHHHMHDTTLPLECCGDVTLQHVPNLLSPFLSIRIR